ncbi:MAG: S1C family serine protease [Bryobacteraceae bacterium]
MNAVDTFDLQGYSNSIAQTVEQAGRSVVAVKSAAYRVTSGVIFREDLVAVNNHILRREGPITVQLGDGSQQEAAILGRDPGLDLAVLWLKDVKLEVLDLEPEEGQRAGALAIVVGRTIDSGLSASAGILGAVSGPRRTWRGGELHKFLRLDVNLYPSQAGAAVVSATGRFLGMATPALLRHSALAVPNETLNRIADELRREGRIRQGYLGVGLQPVAIPEHLRSKSPAAGESGLMVLSVEPGTGAEEAGVQLGDILIAFGDATLTDTETLMGALRGDAVGKPMKLTLIRAGNLMEITVHVADKSSKRK